MIVDHLVDSIAAGQKVGLHFIGADVAADAERGVGKPGIINRAGEAALIDAGSSRVAFFKGGTAQKQRVCFCRTTVVLQGTEQGIKGRAGSTDLVRRSRSYGRAGVVSDEVEA